VLASFEGLEVFIEDLKESKSIAFYQIKEDGEYEEVTTMPTSGYKLNEERSVCSNSVKPQLEGNNLRLTNMTKGSTSCYLYFDKQTIPPTVETIIGDTNKTEKVEFSGIATSSDTGIYSAPDDYGTSYYFRGLEGSLNNWVRFADSYWRIIRVNGNGTVRMIYAGAASGNPSNANRTGTTTQINGATYMYNHTYNDNAYVGFKYTIGQLRGLNTKSNVLTQLETWYNNNLASYASKLDTNAGFCGDRTPSTSETAINNSGGTGTTTTYYGGYIRLITNKTPEITCTNSSDLYTISNSSKGNKSLTYPIGLITADEVSMAGGVYNIANQNYYLYNGRDYWTLSPYVFDSYSAKVFAVYTNGYVGDSVANNIIGVRPVINLRSNVKITGKGTISDPYIVS